MPICAHCDGLGTCPACDGEGTMDGDRICPECEGSCLCRECAGTGQVDEDTDLDDDPSEAEHADWRERAADCGAEMRRI